MSLLSLIERDTKLRKVSGTRGGEYHGPCPFCGGRDRFIVQPGRGERGKWSCRQCSPHWNDDISYLMRRDNLRFVEARDRLLGPPDARHTCERRPAPPPADAPADMAAALHDPDWQTAALGFIRRSLDCLRGPYGAKARHYLERRGLSGRVCVAHALGYNDISHRERWGSVNVYLPRGIVLPWRLHERILRVNLRQPLAEPKYLQAAGGANALYRADAIRRGATVALVEGEIDALSLVQALGDGADVVPVATGSASGARMLPWVTHLLRAEAVLLAFDDDAAGDAAADWWAAVLGPAARRLRPTRHDVNAMLAAGDDVAAWVHSVTSDE